jgi:hypothetical protein
MRDFQYVISDAYGGLSSFCASPSSDAFVDRGSDVLTIASGVESVNVKLPLVISRLVG